MAFASFRASAPGKLMLLGEHAVLHGSRCLVFAVDQRLSVVAAPRNDRRLLVESSHGRLLSHLDDLQVAMPFTFMLTAVKTFPYPLPGGMELKVVSEFAADVGLGSSAAVTAATTAALLHAAGRPFDRREIFDLALKTILAVQGKGSGADLAASVFGGLLLYRAQPQQVEPLPRLLPVSVVYSGHKTPTTQVIERVEARRSRLPQLFESLYAAADASAVAAADAVRRDDLSLLGELLDVNQGIMEALGVCSRRLADIVYALRACPGIYGAKISGSGLGDCVVGLGQAQGDCGYPLLPIRMSAEGVSLD